MQGESPIQAGEMDQQLKTLATLLEDHMAEKAFNS